ncbi:hypothetical protein PS2_023015 [Malus domestica]
MSKMGISISLFTHPTFFVFFAMILYVLHVLFSRFLRVYEFSCQGPPSYPVIGCFISFYNNRNRNRLLHSYTDLLAESTTNAIVVARFGTRRKVVTAYLENVEYMLKTNFNNFPKGKALQDFNNFPKGKPLH